jgi:type III secretion system YscJ/HrcJ family lipoprotein
VRLVSLPTSLVRSSVSSLVSTIALCAVLSVTAACEGVRELMQGLDEFEANEIMVVLEAKGIAADKVKLEGRVVTYAIVVPESDAKNALRILVANKLPKRRPMGLAEVYPAGSGGLIPTRSEEKAKFLMALQGEVERKLQRLPGIQSAHVTIVQPDKDIVRDLDTAPPPATASVAIVFNAYDDRGTSLISQVVDSVRGQGGRRRIRQPSQGPLLDLLVLERAWTHRRRRRHRPLLDSAAETAAG